ncbi:MAG TPA: ABC transporter ATP-binding protein [Gaiellaceae bacterium]|nr:ABC transporter ATP-binding protein [Gaiellaceae bacterium]
MALLELTDVRAHYGQVRALHGVTLTVEEGEIVALLGANGAGKTTTLRAISAMVAREGTLRFDGRPLGRTAESVARRGITHVPEGRGIFGELTVWENLQMGVYLRRDRRAAQRELAELCDETPWFRDRRGQQAGTLSGGEQQLLALGRARLTKPRLVLLDEPSLGLAPLVVQRFFEVVRRLNAEQGVTVLVVEQNAAIALEASHRAYVLEVGRVALAGPSAELAKDEAVRSSYLGY